MITDSDLTLLRSIKKTAAVLLLIMRLDPHPVGETEVAQLLQINPETARAHLKQLSYSHLIARSGHFNGYILTFGGRQLILPSADSSAENPRMTAPTTTTTIDDSEISDAAAVEAAASSAENPRMTAENPRMTALRNAGIGEPKRSKLAARAGITPEIVEAWEKHLKKTKGAKYQIGLLIRILESGDPPPKQSSENQRYDEGPYSEFIENSASRRRYIEGPYADFIEH